MAYKVYHWLLSTSYFIKEFLLLSQNSEIPSATFFPFSEQYVVLINPDFSVILIVSVNFLSLKMAVSGQLNGSFFAPFDVSVKKDDQGNYKIILSIVRPNKNLVFKNYQIQILKNDKRIMQRLNDLNDL